MERTRSSGIYIDAGGNRIIDKWFKGQRVFARLGKVSQDDAEAYLGRRVDQIRTEKLFGENPRRTFREGAIKHLTEEQERLVARFGTVDGKPHKKAQKQLDDIAWHLGLLDPFIGDLLLDEVCDEVLRPFVDKRCRDGVSAKTVRLSLEQVRRILNKAARNWRENRRPWLSVQPPAITMPKGLQRSPMPICRAEQDAIFARLPGHLAEMCLFAVNTGLREQEVCGLRWEWERRFDDGVSVFLIPPARHKGQVDHRIVVLNSQARAVIEGRRGLGKVWVFESPKTKKPLACLNNTPWQKARKAAGLPGVRIHDLKHTYGERLQAAGVPFELKQVLLGHKNGSVTTHYSMPRVRELIEASERAVTASESVSLVRVIAGSAGGSPAIVPQQMERATAKVAQPIVLKVTGPTHG